MQNGYFNENPDSHIVIKRAFNTKALSDFNCGIKIMDDFIHNELQDAITINQDLYIVYDNDKVIGMFCLANASYHINETAKQNILKKLKPKPKPGLNADSIFWDMPSHPAVEITYFAVNEKLRNKGVGKYIIEEIFKMLSSSVTYTQPVATVRALQIVDENIGQYSAIDFYKKCGFSLAEDIVPNKNIFMYRVVNKK